ncbi:hypothetical protein Srufu_078840 [Streptomyces libani subsp. rufus]|nr:hypothetical protein Srufu_078840 [Streptomyces libani subsp. rufus]
MIDEILRADLDAPRKQQHTVTRSFTGWSSSTARMSPTGSALPHAGRKPEILVESGKAALEAFVPQTHLPGLRRRLTSAT